MCSIDRCILPRLKEPGKSGVCGRRLPWLQCTGVCLRVSSGDMTRTGFLTEETEILQSQVQSIEVKKETLIVVYGGLKDKKNVVKQGVG